MLDRLGRFTVRRHRRILLATLVAFAVAGTVGGGVADHLTSGGFENPKAESIKAKRVVEDQFRAGDPNLVLLVTARNSNVDDPAVASGAAALTQELADTPGIQQSVSYWTLGSPPPLRGNDGKQALVLARIGGDEDTVNARVEELSPAFTRQNDAFSVRVSGFAEVFRQVGETIEADLVTAEGIALLITLVLLVVVFGSVVAAGLPVGIGVLSIVGTFFVLRVLAELTQVSIYSLNLTTFLGLGLAIDYSLFVVSRYREELRRGLEPADAVVRSVQTAGRTVLFSAGTVAVSLAALLVFPLAFLRSFAYAGMAVVAVAAVASVVVLPAALAGLGRNIDRLAIFHRPYKDVGEGFWHRIAVGVMRRPLVTVAAVVTVLLMLGIPFLRIRLGNPDDRVLPPSISSRQVQDEIRRNFSSREAGSVLVVATDAGGRLVAPPGPVSARFTSGDGTWLSVVPSVEPVSARGERLVKDVRAAPSPFPVSVAGLSAELVDSKASILGRLPLAAGIITVITFTLLFLMFGSVLVPLKAVVLNLLSLTATFGAMVWIFQDGHLSGFLGFTPTGSIMVAMPILMFCIAFGLSMDYEVFLLSRIKEEHDRTGDNERSVAIGLERTGRIVTAAAALLGVVFLAMATSRVSFMKLFGIGLTMAVLMDATLIRATLVPAFMKLAGEANWWAPGPMRRFHERWGLSETQSAPHDVAGLAPTVERVG
jgi:RND superfamily putative drug exporter